MTKRVPIYSLSILVLCSAIASSFSPQERQGASESQSTKLRKQLEPGVVIYGVKNRFAEVGDAFGFDSSPDGRTLAFTSGLNVKLFDLVENKITGSLSTQGEYYSHVRYSPDGRRIFAGGRGQNSQAVIHVFDAILNTSIGTITSKLDNGDQQDFYLFSMEVSTDGNYVALLGIDSIQVREVSSGDLVYHCDGLDVGGACFTPDEKHIVFPKNNVIAVVDIRTGEQRTKAQFPAVGQEASQMSANISSNRLVVPTSSGLGIYKLSDEGDESDDLVAISLPPGHNARSATFSDDGHLIAAITTDGKQTTKMVVVDVKEKKVVADFPIPSIGSNVVRFSGDNKLLFVSGLGISGVKEINLDEVKQNSERGIESFNQPSGPANRLAMHPLEKTFIAATSGGEICWFDMETGEVNRTISKSNVMSFEFNDSGSDILMFTQLDSESGVEGFDFNTGESKRTYAANEPSEKETIFSVLRKMMLGEEDESEENIEIQLSLGGCYSKDKKTINSLALKIGYSMGTDEAGGFIMKPAERAISLSQFDAESGIVTTSEPVGLAQFGFTIHDFPHLTAVSPRGNQFAIGKSNVVYLVNTKEGGLDLKVETGDEKITRIGFSPDGRFLAISTRKDQRIIRCDNGEEVFQAVGMYPLFEFSENGKRFVVSSSGKDSELKVIDTETWKQVFTRNKTQADRTGVCLSRDGQTVLIGLKDSRVECWDSTKARQLAGPPKKIENVAPKPEWNIE